MVKRSSPLQCVSHIFSNLIRAIGMAEEFPHADVLGIDLVLPNIIADSSRHVPPNCSFRIADANKDMENIDFTYDLIHLRCVEAGILDSDLFFFEAARVLRPGGVLLLVGSNVVRCNSKRHRLRCKLTIVTL